MAAKFTNESQHIFRFSDFPSDPTLMLPPIQGYEGKPLVSLEEAIFPLIPFVPEVERMASRVKQKHFDGEHGLTDDEAASITLYTMEWKPRQNSFYLILNNTLQEANRNLLEPWFLYLRLIMTSLAKLPSDSNRRIVYRGVTLDLSAQYPKGSIVTWWSFSSCTTSIDVLRNEQFVGQSGTRTLFSINCSSAKNIQRYSFSPVEKEALLPPARQFQVTDSLNSSNGLHIIQLKEIEPEFPLINPVPQPIPHPTTPSMPRLLRLPILSTTPSMLRPPRLPNPPTTPVLSSKPLPNPLATLTLSSEPFSDPPTSLQPPKSNDPDLQKYIDAMYLDQTLTTLNLEHNEIGAKGAQDLANALQINKTLTTLNIYNSQIGAEGATHLANALEINETLTTLNLGWNKIGDQGARNLANALQVNKVTTILVLLPLNFTS
ncbi:unnamed protein product [Adineta steineri]|uniref:NAD(P)(+)--arginine ADP-ribosyltransferase n=1 Tax=Adineta steineri TaxID=433720 RepID=A0A819K0X8_9BILA|nr:unnamed protein product [Adineta steineri]